MSTACGLATLAGVRPVFTQDLVRGEIVADVQCLKDASQHYALYLPSNFDPSRSWPVIFVFDPGARGRQGVERYQPAAEKYGYIVAGSNNSRNGPIEPSMQAGSAMWNDVHARFRIDLRRHYLTGLSGGSRMAALTAMLCKDCVAGVFGQGAGFSPSLPPTKETRFIYFGAIGELDFNYTELLQLDSDLEKLGVTHRIELFDGGHEYAKAETVADAFGWFEVQAMRRGLRPHDPKLAAQIYADDMKYAQALESRQQLYRAYREYQRMLSDFAGLSDTSSAQARAAELGKRKEVKEGATRERLDFDQHQRLAHASYKALDQIREEPTERMAAVNLLRAEWGGWKKKILAVPEEKRRTPELLLYRRVFSQVLAQAIELGQRAEREKDYPLALTYFDLVIEYARAAPLAQFEKAKIFAQTGKKQDALALLEAATKGGFSDRQLLENTHELDVLRDEPRFQALLAALSIGNGTN